MSERERRCQAMTTKKRRCRSQAVQYLIHADDGQEYLTCKKLHAQEFRPYPQAVPATSRKNDQLRG